MYTCRECEKAINQASEICPYCGADLTVPAGGETQEPAKKRRLTSILLIWGAVVAVIAGGLWAFVWYILPGPKGDAALRAEMQAVEAMADVRVALAAYAGAQGGYPKSLEALGDRARGPAQKALSEGYQVQYTPGSVGPDGAIHSYVLLARPSNYGYRNFYTDEAGVFRATRENRPATPQDPLI